MDKIIQDIWSVVFPIVQLLAITVGPVLATVIATRASSLLRIKDDDARADFEKKLRDALHQAAINALKVATTRMLTAEGGMTQEALGKLMIDNRGALVEYVKSKNPEAIAHFQLDNDAIMDIIRSKVPDLFIGPASR